MTKDRKKQIKINDDLCRDICRLRDKVCIICGAPPRYESFVWIHYIGRRNHHVRWNLDNSGMGHKNCHQSCHKRPHRFTELMKTKLGEKYWLLRTAANDTSQIDYEAIETSLRQIKEALCQTNKP